MPNTTTPKRTCHLIGCYSDSDRRANALFRLVAYAQRKGHEVRVARASTTTDFQFVHLIPKES